MRKILESIILALAFLATYPAWGITNSSTINPGIPAQGSPISSSPIRQNFTAAYNDINTLYAMINAGIENNPPGGTIGQFQYNGGSGTFLGVTMGGDCTWNYNTGVITCLYSNGVPLGTFAALIPTGTAIPVNGIYRPFANTLGFATNSTFAGMIDASQNYLVGYNTAIGIGSSPITPKVEVIGNSDNSGTTGVYRFSADAYGASVSLQKSRSATINGQTAVQTGDELGKLRAYGSDGTNFQQAGAVRISADATPSAGIVPGRVGLFTANASGTLTEGLRQDRFQHLESLGTIPTCGTGCSTVGTGSTDVRGYFTTGTSVTSANLSFASTYDSIPFCVVSSNTNATVTDISNITTTALTVSFAAAITSTRVYYHCIE